jgi:hypothetical protein
MPNGGPDCCGNCAYNPKGGVCVLRDVIILGHKMSTYCANFSHSARADVEIKGPIFSTGLYEGYVRIPWLGDRAPRSDCPVKCFDCGDHVENGIEVELRTGEKFGFCCNKNYVLWWSSRTAEHHEWAPKLQELEGCPKDIGNAVNSFVTKPHK